LAFLATSSQFNRRFRLGSLLRVTNNKKLTMIVFVEAYTNLHDHAMVFRARITFFVSPFWHIVCGSSMRTFCMLCMTWVNLLLSAPYITLFYLF
jgi:hypothetical protein